MKSNRSCCPKWLIRMYRLFLLAYPKAFREQYGNLMEQAFIDSYSDYSARKKSFELLHFAKNTLSDSCQSISQEHWHANEQAGFARMRFIILLPLLIALFAYQHALISKTSEFFEITLNIEKYREDAFYKQLSNYQINIGYKLSQSEDMQSKRAAQYLLTYPVHKSYHPNSFVLMKSHIAKAIVEQPFKPSWYTKVPDYWHSTMPILLLTELVYDSKTNEHCNPRAQSTDMTEACILVRRDRALNGKFIELMFNSSSIKPTEAELAISFQRNSVIDFQKKYIELNR